MKTLRHLRIFLIGCFCVLFLQNFQAEAANRNHLLLQTDTVLLLGNGLHVYLPEVEVIHLKKRSRKYKRQSRKYWRMVRNVRIAYPYAQEANRIILRLEGQLKTVDSKKERRKLIKKEYKALMKKYKKPLMKLSISQGRILMKLVYRESGNSSYYHIKELKGTLTAVFWQSIAAMFGTSLKAEYDPLGNDRMLEDIIKRMEKGELPPPKKLPN